MAKLRKEWLRDDRRTRERLVQAHSVELAVNTTGLSQDRWLQEHEIVAWLGLAREPERDYAHCVYLNAQDIDLLIDKLLPVATKAAKARAFSMLAESLSDRQILDTLAKTRKP